MELRVDEAVRLQREAQDESLRLREQMDETKAEFARLSA